MHRIMVKRRKAANMRNETPDRAVWYADNTRPKSYKFRCSACMKTALAIPHIIRIPGVGYVRRCNYQYCPNCGIKMITEEDMKK